ASRRGDEAAAVRALRAALAGFEACHMKLFLAVSERRLGELIGGDEGRALVHQANAWMTAQGIVNADRMTATLAPGFSDRVDPTGAGAPHPVFTAGLPPP